MAVKPPKRPRAEIVKCVYERRQAALEEEASRFPSDNSLRGLCEAQEQLGHSLQTTPQDMDVIRRDMAKFNQANRNAYRAGHTNHPHVREWFAARRSLGDRDELRALKNTSTGLTSGVMKMMSPADVWLLGICGEMQASSPEGIARPGVIRQIARKALRRADWLPAWMDGTVVQREEADNLKAELETRLNATPQNFDKWCRKLAIPLKK